ncbi:MAG: OsmC family protein [Aquificaceae bacterium]
MEEKRVVLKLSQEEHTYLAKGSYGELLVGEKGHRPMELLLIALAGCSGVDISHILRKKRQDVRDIEVIATGIRKDEHPRVYESIKLLYRVYGKNIKEKAVEEALRLSLGKYCSVYAMLNKACKIEMSFEVIDEA